ncbi:MAG: glutamate--tRNA ligase [Thermoanaerobaculia bacterium]
MVRTRFAPSPTGYLHIGGVRTALFNWLFTRQQGGQFVLRIDDTDQERNVEESLEPILDGFRWLGLDWDEGPEVGGDHGPYYQSQRQDHYRAAVQALIDNGLAYYDYANAEEIGGEREAAREAGERFIYSRNWMATSPEEQARFEAEGRQGVVRLKMPREGVCRFTDLIRGEMEFEWAREQDHVIERADGTCLYHLANVVDDYEMRISHVIRAEEHLSNTPRHIFIAEGLGYEPPAYAHLPYVAEPGSKNKLSKRKLDKYLKDPEFAKLNEHGQAIADAIGLETDAEAFNPVIVDFYEKVGYLPHALLNYLLLLGWSLDGKTEFFSREEMIELFSLERVNRAPAAFDPAKLMAFEEHFMQELALDEKVDMVLPYLEATLLLTLPPTDEDRSYVESIVRAAGDRIKVAGDIIDYADFFTPDDQLLYDMTAFEKRLQAPAEAAALLTEYRDHLAALDDFDAESLETDLRSFAEEKGIKIGQIIHAVRVAVTGKAVGFGLFEAIEILGRERCLARIDRALSLI